jgi:polysaccharide biosynthesis protein PslH
MSHELRLVVVAQEFPYPPNHGGRADVWRRLRAFKELGVKLALVCWYEAGTSTPSGTDIAAVRQVVDCLHVVPKKGGMRRSILRLWRIAEGIPSHAAARVMEATQYADALKTIKSFVPDAVFLDSPYGGVFASKLCETLGLPMFYRSHNIEHKYFESQAEAAGSLRNKLAWRLACLHLHGFEKRMQQQSAVVFDISADDLRYWQSQGISTGVWLPPLPEAALDTDSAGCSQIENVRELAFLGNLHAPNNVRGLLWFVNEVMPQVWAKRPQTIFTIAGARPVEDIKRLAKQCPQLQLVENVADATDFLASSCVLVNPVLTGSGVNVKTLDMLMTARPIVSTSQGVTGLPPDIKALCMVADSAADFATKILEALAKPEVDLKRRVAGRAAFSLDSVEAATQLMRSRVKDI